MHVERTFAVPRTPREVFAFLADFRATEQWDPGTVSTTRTSGDGGLGTTYANVSEFLGRRVEVAYETVVFEPPSKLRFRGVNGRAVATDSLTLSATVDGTSIHYRADFRFGLPLDLVVPLVMRRRIERLADETVAQMTAVLTALD